MEKRDGRSISHEAMEEIRIRAVQRVEAGESPEVVIKALGFSRGRIYDWLPRLLPAGQPQGPFESARAGAADHAFPWKADLQRVREESAAAQQRWLREREGDETHSK